MALIFLDNGADFGYPDLCGRKTSAERKTMPNRYGVNLLDVGMLPETPVQLLLQPVIPNRKVHEGNLPDDMVLELECDEKRAKAICVLFATQLSERYDTKYPVRAYRIGPQGGIYNLSKKKIEEMDRELKEGNGE